MKVSEIKSIHLIIRESTNFEVAFVSLFVLPIYLGLWLLFIEQLDLCENQKYFILISVTLGYIVSIILMKLSQSQKEKDLRNLVRIKSKILSKEDRYSMSFENLREYLEDESLTDEYLKVLVVRFPDEITVQRITNKGLGIKILKNNT